MRSNLEKDQKHEERIEMYLAMLRKRLLLLLLLPQLLHYLSIVPGVTAAAAASWPMAKPGCRDMCGNITIPYPFGITNGRPDCSLPRFEVTCNESISPPKAFLGSGNLEIIDISLLQAEVRVHQIFIEWKCFDGYANYTNNTAYVYLTREYPYRFSYSRNKFTVIGCYNVAYIIGQSDRNFVSGCASFCDNLDSPANGSCSGTGCCQTIIPEDVSYYEVECAFDYNPKWNFAPCSYGVVVEDSYNFTISDLTGSNFYYNRLSSLSVVLDWAVRNHNTCSQAKGQPDYACRSENSSCHDSANGVGYLCNCSQGYEGNPYLENGCTDINECNDEQQYPCHGKCKNLPGSYSCDCPSGTRGDPTKQKCADILPLAVKLVVGACLSAIVVLALCFLIAMKLQKRKYMKEKDEYFNKNGGFRLYEEMRSRQVDTIRIFTEMDLEKATNKFDKDRILGCGGRGMVYKGNLEDSAEVAIKKSKIVDEDQREEFVNEIIILSQVNHRNVVRLLGCCLEVDVPMLVYEFVSNGTLFDLLHGKNGASPVPLDTRLRIAVESAEALAYLHSSTARSILHGDVKSSNILLDNNYKAKVSDFGASKLVPIDDAQFVMFVQGTKGYLDPECLYTGKLTEKSDVYSFGVVLLELITRKKAIYTDDSNEMKNLASSFVSMVNQNKLQDILDDQIQEEGAMDVLEEVAKIAIQCLSVKGEERPTMMQVVEDLKRLMRFKQHPWGPKNAEETESLLGGAHATYTASDSAIYHTQETNLTLNIETGR